MASKHLKTLAAIFEMPVRSNIAWSDIEKMLNSFGAEVSEGSGSRVRIALGGVRRVSSSAPAKGNRQRGSSVDAPLFN